MVLRLICYFSSLSWFIHCLCFLFSNVCKVFCYCFEWSYSSWIVLDHPFFRQRLYSLSFKMNLVGTLCLDKSTVLYQYTRITTANLLQQSFITLFKKSCRKCSPANFWIVELFYCFRKVRLICMSKMNKCDEYYKLIYFIRRSYSVCSYKLA